MKDTVRIQRNAMDMIEDIVDAAAWINGNACKLAGADDRGNKEEQAKLLGELTSDLKDTLKTVELLRACWKVEED